MSRKQNLYIGRSGQMAVMAEFLARGYNVAVPEVDRGDDLFVVRDADGSLSRIQVKSAIAKATRQGFSARFKVKQRQLEEPQLPDLHFVFTTRWQRRWAEFLLIPRAELFDEVDAHQVGSRAGRDIWFHLVFTG
ncbi:MAG: group I intron-associated PD-(D/E)XK endonuclease [Myxococcota bacterium]